MNTDQRLAYLVQSAADAIVAIDLDGNITDWNIAAESLYGYARDEIIGRPVRVIVPERLLEHFQTNIEKVKAGQSVLNYHTVRVKKGGEEIEISLTISPIRNEQTRLIGISAVARNLSREDRLLRQISEDQTLLGVLTESAPNGILVVDENGKITLCNKRTELLFGYKREELVGQPVEMLIPTSLRSKHPHYRKTYSDNPTERQMGAGRDLTGLRKDGTVFPVEVGLAPIRLQDRHLVTASVIDITERKVAQENLQQTNRELARRNEEVEQFIYTISHDLKSPLVTIQSFLGFLKDDLKSGDHAAVEDSLKRLSAANSRMTDLIGDLLQLSRVGLKKLNFEQINTGHIVSELKESIESELGKDDQMTVTTPLPTLVCDRLKLSQGLDNLLRNAIRYGRSTEHPLHIEISATETDTAHVFTVADNGPGIDPKYHDKIFGLFQRLDSSAGGTGVGLTIVRRVADLHHGTAWVESSPGFGARFSISISKNIKLTNEQRDDNE